MLQEFAFKDGSKITFSQNTAMNQALLTCVFTISESNVTLTLSCRTPSAFRCDKQFPS